VARNAKGVSVAELSQKTESVVRRVRNSRRPLKVTEGGRTQLVLLSAETFERSERERQILLALARGEREIAAGRGFSLERVLGDADKVFARSRK
jgi:PHD/YefM family antitoxin component YafN of YafNO toxin-antitoxin module